MRNNIAGKVVVITGASSGLGEATARHLAAEGASVVLGARRTDRIKSLAAELTGKGSKALALATDVTYPDQVKRLVDAAVEKFGRIDVMLNNAGLMPLAPLERLNIDDWDRTIDVNIKGVLYGIAAALPYMKQQKSGHIINVSSTVSACSASRYDRNSTARALILPSLSPIMPEPNMPIRMRSSVGSITPGA